MTAFFVLSMYLNWKNYLYICIRNPKKEINKLRGIFKPIKCYFRCGINSWSPVWWFSIPSKIQIISKGVGWKDKYDTPRFETPPYVWIHLFGLDLVWYWSFLPGTTEEDKYWEQVLWYLYYYNNTSYGADSPDIKKAKHSWPWEDEKGFSTWSNKFLVK